MIVLTGTIFPFPISCVCNEAKPKEEDDEENDDANDDEVEVEEVEAKELGIANAVDLERTNGNFLQRARASRMKPYT